MNTLMEILSLRRPHGGENERKVALDILSRLPHPLEVFNNAAGAPMAYVICTNPESRTLFTAHLDTVHKDELTPNPVLHDPKMGWMHKLDGTPLGADCGAGVWLLYKMIEAGVPGTYLFPLGEERGGVGATWMGTYADEFLAKFDRAIAFDRADTTDVITHQGWTGRCCSDEFAQALADKLNAGRCYPSVLKPDPTGVYTDTAEFTEIISECTNVSIGYHAQHTANETLDTRYLQDLLTACIRVDWESLPAVRDPAVVDARDYGSSQYSWLAPTRTVSNAVDLVPEDLEFMREEDIFNLAYDTPELAAELLIAVKYQYEASAAVTKPAWIDAEDIPWSDDGFTGYNGGH